MQVRMFITQKPKQSQSKMKLSIVILAILGVSAAAALPAGKVLDRPTRSLNDDLADFAALVPVDEVLVIFIQYLAEDAEVQAAVEYLTSEDFLELVLAVEAIPEYIELLDFLEEGGLAVYAAVNKLHEILGLPGLVPSSRTISRLLSTRITGGVSGLIHDIKGVCDLEAIRALYKEKLETSEDFAALVALIASDDFQAAVATVKANPQFQALREKALAAGLDLEALSELLSSLLDLA